MSEVDLPDGLSARPARAADVEAVTSLIAAHELDLHGVVDIDPEDVRSDWDRPSYDLERDTLVVVDGGERFVAYASAPQGLRASVHVHPEVKGRGIGSALLAWTEERAEDQGRDKVDQTISDADLGARALLEAHGYRERWQTWIFQIALADEILEPALPEGVVRRHFDAERDGRELYDVIDTAFSDWSDRDASESFEDWAASSIRRKDFDPSLTFALEDTSTRRLVGAAYCLVYGDEGWVEQLAVERSHRGRGLGGALLRMAFRAFRDRGLPRAGLSTESRTGARGLYEHVGMHVARSYTRYTKHLS